ncbi:MAG: hypothetical protein ABR555_19965, partial [Pyrinomonadaceae bacterium]
MKSKLWLILAILIVTSVHAQAQTTIHTERRASIPVRYLRNSDVLAMVTSGMTPDAIAARMVTSNCNFDIFPPVLEDLRRRGVPDVILHMMTVVPNGPANLDMSSGSKQTSRERAKVKMQAGMAILVETLYPISSADVKEGSTITFVVPRPVYIDGVLAIARGAIARARVVRVRRAQNWGRSGMLTLEMENIVAVDGTLIPVELSLFVEGDGRVG